MTEETDVVEIFVNEDKLLVAKDSRGRWRIYDPVRKKLTLFANPPQKGARPVTPPAPEDAEPAPDPLLADISERVDEVAEAVAAKQPDMHAEVERLRSDIAAVTAARDQAYSDKLRLERELDQLLKAKDDQQNRFETLRDQCSNFQRAAEECSRREQEARATLAQKDTRITELERQLQDVQNRPQATHREYAFYERWYQQKDWLKLSGFAVLLAVLLFFMLNGMFHWTVKTPDPSGEIASLTSRLSTLQSDKLRLEGELSASKTAQTAAEGRATAAEAKAKDATDKLTQANQDATNAKAAQKKAEDELAALKRQTPATTPAAPATTLPPTAAPPSPEPKVSDQQTPEETDRLLEYYRKRQSETPPMYRCTRGGRAGWCSY